MRTSTIAIATALSALLLPTVSLADDFATTFRPMNECMAAVKDALNQHQITGRQFASGTEYCIQTQSPLAIYKRNHPCAAMNFNNPDFDDNCPNGIVNYKN
jgi:hypothetical protein